MFRRSQTPGRTAEQLLLMRRAGLLVGQTLELLRAEIRPGVTTLALDALAEDFIRSHGGIPNFQLVPGYAHTLCTSVNEEVVHGIPSDRRVLREGDLVSVDCGAELEGWNGDAAFSTVVGGRDAARPEDLRLIDVTEDALWAGITALVVGGRLYAVGEAVEESIESASAADGHDYGIIEEYVGHAIGRSMHEDPQIPNYGGPRPGADAAVRVHRGHRADGHLRQQCDPRPRRRLDGRHQRRVTGGALGALGRRDRRRPHGADRRRRRRRPPRRRVRPSRRLTARRSSGQRVHEP